MTNARRWNGISLCVTITASATSGCGAPADMRKETGRTPTLSVIDTVRLRETDANFLGQAVSLAVARNGDFFVGDALNLRVARYDSRGAALKLYGRRGRGPGELVQLGSIAVDDTTVYARDNASRLIAFDMATAKQRWERRLPSALVWDLVTHGGKILFNRLDTQRRTTMAFVRSHDDSATSFGPYPAPLTTDPRINGWYSWTRMGAVSADTLAAAFQASSDWVYFGSVSTGSFDSVRVPILKRRGALAGGYKDLDTNDPTGVQHALYDSSHPWAVGSMGGSLVGYATMDQDRVNNRWVGTMYVSIVDLARKSACADALVPVVRDPQPFAVFRGDTLNVLEQSVDSAGRAVARVVRFRVDASSC